VTLIQRRGREKRNVKTKEKRRKRGARKKNAMCKDTKKQKKIYFSICFFFSFDHDFHHSEYKEEAFYGVLRTLCYSNSIKTIFESQTKNRTCRAGCFWAGH